jgi:hypothetical protein
MTKPGFFDRSPTIKTHGEMVERLAMRTGQVCGSSGVEGHADAQHTRGRPVDGLQIAPDNPLQGNSESRLSENQASPAAALPIPSAVIPDALSDERRIALEWKGPVKATQATQDGRYEIRGTRLKESLLYYAWVMQPVPKLLGYPSTPEAARQLCQGHADNQP